MEGLILDPLEFRMALYFPVDVISRRFAVDHACREDGRVTGKRPWVLPRSANPASEMSAPIAEQTPWARFRLGEGTARDETGVLSAEALRQMQEPTADTRASARGDYVGIPWLLAYIDRERIVGHGSTINGQYSGFLTVPGRRFAFIGTPNSGPNGLQLNHRLREWALEHYLGLTEREPEILSVGDGEIGQYLGRHETIAASADITADKGHLVVVSEPKAEIAAILGDDDDHNPPIPLNLVAGGNEHYFGLKGPAKGMRRYYTRDGAGPVNAVRLGGRLAERVGDVPAPSSEFSR